ncbi:CRISPR-associated endonuclease Cas2 [Candidatus Azambacteria bacterium]|nr:CRISPR-associated endonuclease Cas2 [Candidatus Azambacteria bacterium]
MPSLTKQLLVELLETVELMFYAPDMFLTPGQRRRKHELLRKRRRALFELERQGFVEREGRGKRAKFTLSEAGEIRARLAKLATLKLPKEPRWDGKWRLVMFDIPEKQKAARDSLRLKLRHLGMKQAQKSVFAYPYECREVVDFVTELFDVRPYIRYAVASSLDGDRDLKDFFGF